MPENGINHTEEGGKRRGARKRETKQMETEMNER